MRKTSTALCCGLVALVVGTVNGPAAAGGIAAAVPIAAAGITGTIPATATRTSAAPAGPVSSAARPVGTQAIVAALAAATITPARAVSLAQSQASSNGVADYISVTNRSTGAVIAQSANAGTQVASESIMKLMLASYYLVLVGGYQHQSQGVLNQLSYMIRYSDDATANEYFTSSAVPTIAARYGMRSTINATDRVGHWGSVRITARDMTTFLYRAAHDSQVGPWLIPVMAQVAPTGSDGFNQAFGMNSLSGTHGSKQGWGGDQFWTPAHNVINSVGYTDRYNIAILQNSYSYPDPARATSTYAARTIAASRVAVATPPPPPPPPAAPKDGDFVRAPGASPVYRIAGGAPVYVSTWTGFGGPHPVRNLTAAQWAALRSKPLDGTFLRTTMNNQVFRMAGGAPIYVSGWAPFNGQRTTVLVDVAAVTNAGRSGAWSHLSARPADGTFLAATGGTLLYRVAGGAPLYVTSLSAFTGVRPVTIDAAAISHGGQLGAWNHLLFYPADGTFLLATPGATNYRVGNGHATRTSSSGGHPFVTVNNTTVDRAGTGGPFNHLR